MLAWLRQRETLRRTARSLYGSIVTQARSHVFFADWGVPDTREGRFEVIALHLVLVLRRLAAEGPPRQALGRALTEAFVVDLDDTLREMTVGDLAVPKQVKRAVAVLHDRYSTYGAALDSPAPEALGSAVQARLGELSGAQALDVEAISAYIREAAGALARQAGVEVLAGQLAWPQVHAGSGDRTDAG
jgi:cytochrome b pre-mRNA-processing protein 3